VQNVEEHNKANEIKWDKRSKEFDKKGLRTTFFRFVQKEIISITNPQINSNFLDLGCGSGWAV
jgi:ubiquinone/menaquinone biosynthesis C-methylase UbiE